MIKFFWKFNRRLNYHESQELTNLIYKCIDLIENCPNADVRITEHEIVIKTSSSKVVLWNANKFYAWLSSGSVNGRKFKDISPSINAMYDFKNFLKKNGYNIYIKDKPLYDSVVIDDVRC